MDRFMRCGSGLREKFLEGGRMNTLDETGTVVQLFLFLYVNFKCLCINTCMFEQRNKFVCTCIFCIIMSQLYEHVFIFHL